jgi:4-hydroxybenzoate polyprenyltransferase
VKSFYDKEPVTGLIITAGAVNALLGGINVIGTPFVLGLAAAGGSIAYRWWMIKKADRKRRRVGSAHHSNLSR